MPYCKFLLGNLQVVPPPVVDDAWLTTPFKRAATVLRVPEAVVLKYSLNLDAEPELAAVEAALDKLAAFVSALLKELIRAEVQLPCTREVRFSSCSKRFASGAERFWNFWAALAPSTSMLMVLDSKRRTSSESSVESALATRRAPAAATS